MTQFASNQKLTVSGGTQIIDHTNAVTAIKAQSIEATEDTVISVCTGINGDDDTTAINFKTNAKYNWLNLKSGDVVFCEADDYITAVTLTSGRILLHKV